MRAPGWEIYLPQIGWLVLVVERAEIEFCENITKWQDLVGKREHVAADVERGKVEHPAQPVLERVGVELNIVDLVRILSGEGIRGKSKYQWWGVVLELIIIRTLS